VSFDPEVHDVISKNVQEHIEGIPILLHEIFPQMKKIWKFDNSYNFVYGWYVGRLECHAQHIFFDNMGRWPEGEELMEIKEIIEIQGKNIREKISQNIGDIDN
jgi:hypothetical protein